MLNYQDVMPTAMFFDAVHLRPEGASAIPRPVCSTTSSPRSSRSDGGSMTVNGATDPVVHRLRWPSPWRSTGSTPRALQARGAGRVTTAVFLAPGRPGVARCAGHAHGDRAASPLPRPRPRPGPVDRRRRSPRVVGVLFAFKAARSRSAACSRTDWIIPLGLSFYALRCHPRARRALPRARSRRRRRASCSPTCSSCRRSSPVRCIAIRPSPPQPAGSTGHASRWRSSGSSTATPRSSSSATTC